MKKILVVFGTRPEVIKIAPVIIAFRKAGMMNNLILVNTGQHNDLTKADLDYFNIKFHFNLNVLKQQQSISSLHTKILSGLSSLIQQLENSGENICAVLGQGDTTSTLCATLAAFYSNKLFLHIEAGLRTFDITQPFPEEFNRKVSGIISSFHYAPTKQAKQFLLKEGVSSSSILVTGNTVIDSLKFVINKEQKTKSSKKNKNTVLITLHRRENLNGNLQKVWKAIHFLAKNNEDLTFNWLMHPNPSIRKFIFENKKGSRINFIEPLPYKDIVRMYVNCVAIITDSGGVQEEASFLGIPTIVIREKTERMQPIENNEAFLTGTETKKIITTFSKIIKLKFQKGSDYYGNGKSAEQIVRHINKTFLKTKH